MRIAGTIAVTIVAAVALYSWRAFTFAVWVNAALISHSHPLLTVGAIEFVIVALIAVAVWTLIGLVPRRTAKEE